MNGAVVRRWLPVAAILGLLGAAMFAAVYSNPVISTDPLSRPQVTELPGLRQETSPPALGAEQTAIPREAVALPEWVSWAITVICGLAVAVVVGMLIWMAVRDLATRRRVEVAARRTAAEALQETRRQVRRAVDEGLAGLDDLDADPRRAIIACWVRLEGAAGLAGVPRGAGDTATDLVRRLLSTHLVVSAEVLDDLAAAYLEARFTEHVLGPDVRTRAVTALRQVRTELDRAVRGGSFDRTEVAG